MKSEGRATIAESGNPWRLWFDEALRKRVMNENIPPGAFLV